MGSCIPASDSGRIPTDTYFDINGLIDGQILLLDSISPVLYKEATINGDVESEVVPKLDSLGWTKEIGIFKSADINLPTLSDSYTTNEESGDDVQVVTYKSKSPKDTEVDSLQIVFINDQRPQIVRAYLFNKNVLFSSRKQLLMEFSNEGNQPILRRYTMRGWQKMISKDSTSFVLQGEIRFP